MGEINKFFLQLKDVVWSPTKIVFSSGVEEEYPLPVIDGMIFPNTAGLQYEAQEIRRCLLEGKLF